MNRISSFFYCLLCIVVCLFSVIKADAQIIDTTALEEASYQDEEVESFQVTVPDTPVVRFIPDSVINRFSQKKEYAYANDPLFWIKPKEDSNKPGFWKNLDRFLRNSFVRTIFYVLLASVIVFIVYRLIVNNDFFVSGARSAKQDLSATEENDLIDDEYLDEKIEMAITAGDHRLAIRFLYIKTLQLLNQKSLIRYHSEATNEIYIKQMHNSPKAKDFRFVTQVFEYVWYGRFTLTAEQFDNLYKEFKKFHDSIR